MSDTCKTCQYKGRQEQAVKGNSNISPCGFCIHGNLRDFYTPVKSAFQEWIDRHVIFKISSRETAKKAWNDAIETILSLRKHSVDITDDENGRLPNHLMIDSFEIENLREP